MDWQLRDNSVHIHMGEKKDLHNHVAAFDFDNTLAWSDSGLIFMRTENDWVPTTSADNMISIFTYLIRNNWTIVIFVNQLENNPTFTRNSLERIENFIFQLGLNFEPIFDPYVYVSIRNDKNRKPDTGMWDMFISDANIIPSQASFYCGDALGQTAENHLYRWANYDYSFAKNIGLAFYTPDEILGEFTPIIIPQHTKVLLIMAAHESQYRDYINELKHHNPLYVESSLDDAERLLMYGNSVIVVGERFATKAGRRRALFLIPKIYHNNTMVLMFTRPIKPFIGDKEYKAADLTIRGYANALDFHPKFRAFTRPPRGDEPFTIIRIN